MAIDLCEFILAFNVKKEHFRAILAYSRLLLDPSKKNAVSLAKVWLRVMTPLSRMNPCILWQRSSIIYLNTFVAMMKR